MQNFTCRADVSDLPRLLAAMRVARENPLRSSVGQGKTLGLVFFNPSLRTRMSTQKAAYNLGMNVLTLNVGLDGWQLETADGTIMDGDAPEHARDAIRVMSGYCDVLGVRTFAGLTDRTADYEEKTLSQFLRYSSVPVVSLESATRHPLQSLADLFTIESYRSTARPKVVLTWAPHPRPLPQAVPNSFVEWLRDADVDLVVTHPPGYELAPAFAEGLTVVHDQAEALTDADFVYAKNWSAYHDYGRVLRREPSWMITPEKMASTNGGGFMHCLPLRRNVIATDAVVDGSLVYEQAQNREYAAQAVLRTLLEAD